MPRLGGGAEPCADVAIGGTNAFMADLLPARKRSGSMRWP